MPRIFSKTVLSSYIVILFPPFAISFVIVLLTHPAQIVRAVVAGVAVDVVHGVADFRVRVRTPRLSHQAADKKMACLPEAREAHPIISFIVRKRRQEPRICVFQALDASHVRA